ncbi:MAG: c-type cytochrome [Terriglobales bacterium]
MGKFILGIIFALIVLILIAVGLVTLGFLPTRANVAPAQTEAHIAMSALDSSVERHAPRTNNPVPVTDDNLIEGLKIYTMNCALCHGGIDRQASQLEHSLYPEPPNLITDPDTDPEWHIFFIIKNGVRYTGMPAWDKSLSDDDIWKLTAFLSRVDKLPPAVQEYWKKAAGGAVPVAEAPAESKDRHDHHK